MFTKVLVEIPTEKGIHIKSTGVKKERYVYKYIKYYRNNEGKSRNQSKSIGKYDPVSGKMYPNDNYFEMYNISVTLSDISVWDYGYSYLVLQVCNDIGLLEYLNDSFGEQAMEIIVVASYIIREGNVMDYIDDWQERNYFYDFDKRLTSQTCSRLFASITENAKCKFFKNWISKTFTGGSVCYDVTSISSYSQKMIDIERGYNRDGENLSQFNLGMFCDETTKMPLYYSRYNGSITDKTNLSYVLASAKDLGISRVKMILDGGFWDEECITNLNKYCDCFTLGMPSSLKEATRVLDSHSANIAVYENELTYHHIYCVSVNTEIYGVSGKILLYYDAYSHIRLCEELSERIELLKAELARLKRYPKSKLSRFNSLFEITKHENDSGFDYCVDNGKVEELRKYKGYFLLFSTDMESSPSDILYYYRAKDADEKLFAQIKVDMESNRFRTHNQETTEGKMFITFVACAIRSHMLSKLSPYLAEYSTSLTKAFNQLSNIVVVSNNTDNGIRFTKSLTKKQKQILSLFGKHEDIIESVNHV